MVSDYTLSLLVLQPANYNAGIRPCECWSNNNTDCSPTRSPFFINSKRKDASGTYMAEQRWNMEVVLTKCSRHLLTMTE